MTRGANLMFSRQFRQKSTNSMLSSNPSPVSVIPTQSGPGTGRKPSARRSLGRNRGPNGRGYPPGVGGPEFVFNLFSILLPEMWVEMHG